VSDRNDPSQYPVDESNDNDNTYYGDVTMVDDQIQSQPEGDYASGEDIAQYAGHHNIGEQRDVMSEHPGRFRTNKPTQAQYYAQARMLFPGGGLMIPHPCMLSGWALRESTGGATATVRFRDGADSSSPELVTLNFAINESVRDFLQLPIRVTRGVYMEVVSGIVAGTLFTQEVQYV
jgi:hypothetical protein